MDTAVVTGATAVATGLLGYLGARLQHRGEERRLDIERDRLRLEQTRAESETAVLAAQRLDQQLERRRLLYYDFLDIAERGWSFSVREQPTTESDLDAWWLGFQGVRRQLRVGAATEVVEALEELNTALIDLVDDLLSVIREHGADDAYDERIAVWGRHDPIVAPALRHIEQTMRTDLDVTG